MTKLIKLNHDTRVPLFKSAPSRGLVAVLFKSNQLMFQVQNVENLATNELDDSFSGVKPS